MAKLPSKTQIFHDDFQGAKMFAIYKVDDEGKKLSEFPLIRFGKAKAEAIIKHLPELEEYLKGQK